MYEHQVFDLFEALGIDYCTFDEGANYSETDNGRLFDYSDVANYIDIQLHLKHFQN